MTTVQIIKRLPELLVLAILFAPSIVLILAVQEIVDETKNCTQAAHSAIKYLKILKTSAKLQD